MSVPFETIKVSGRGPEEAARLSALLEGAPPEAVLGWAVEAFGPGLALATSFGRDGLVLLDHLRRSRAAVPILFIDTGFHFPETLRFRDEIAAAWGLTVTNLCSPRSEDDAPGTGLLPQYALDPDRCCQRHKVEPLLKALRGYTAWVSGLRRDQHSGRRTTPVVEWQSLDGDGGGIFQLHPLAGWSRSDVEAYLTEHHLPRHPLWDQGYSSVGCAPCTRTVRPGEPERAGRWSGTGKVECGIHIVGVHRGFAAEMPGLAPRH